MLLGGGVYFVVSEGERGGDARSSDQRHQSFKPHGFRPVVLKQVF